MRFTSKFSRFKGAPGPGLGDDTVPTTAPTPGPNANLMCSRFSNVNGWPCHRIAVTYRGPESAIPLPATMWFWEELTQYWYQIGATVNLNPDAVTFFDVVGLLEGSQASPDVNPTAGSIAALLIVDDPGGAPNGEHIFAMGPDLTTF